MAYPEEYIAQVSHKFNSENLDELKKILGLPETKWLLEEVPVSLDDLLEQGVIPSASRIKHIFSIFNDPESNGMSRVRLYDDHTQLFP